MSLDQQKLQDKNTQLQSVVKEKSDKQKVIRQMYEKLKHQVMEQQVDNAVKDDLEVTLQQQMNRDRSEAFNGTTGRVAEHAQSHNTLDRPQHRQPDGFHPLQSRTGSGAMRPATLAGKAPPIKTFGSAQNGKYGASESSRLANDCRPCK